MTMVGLSPALGTFLAGADLQSGRLRTVLQDSVTALLVAVVGVLVLGVYPGPLYAAVQAAIGGM